MYYFKNKALFLSNNTGFTNGFTLIELIIVIAVLGVLFTALLTTVNPLEQFKKSRDTQRKSSIGQIQRALESYYQDHGQYPASDNSYRIVSIVNSITTTLSWGDTWQPYMDVLPTDPKSPARKFAYYSPVASKGQSYYLFVSLERGASDPAVCNNGVNCTSTPANNMCGNGVFCNFGVTSPNVSIEP